MNPFACLNNSTCPCKAQVEHDIAAKYFFIIECTRCKKVYVSSKDKRKKMRVYQSIEQFRERIKQ